MPCRPEKALRAPALAAYINMNALIGLLPRHEQAQLLSRCKLVHLVAGEDICQCGSPMARVLFPTTGYLSLITGIDAAPAVEVGMVGTEGMVGAQLLLGVSTSPLRVMVQGGGNALSLPVREFRRQVAQSKALDRVLRRYLHVTMTQFATGAPCVHFHAIMPRLARWLLMMHDRAGPAQLQCTHEYLSLMLGVRRAGISVAAEGLQATGLIRYGRGRVEVLDRHALERAACGCYALDRATYASVMCR